MVEMNIEIPEEIFNCTKILDRYYIPTRYPNGFEEGAPMDYYTKKDAQEAIEYAKNYRFLQKNYTRIEKINRRAEKMRFKQDETMVCVVMQTFY